MSDNTTMAGTTEAVFTWSDYVTDILEGNWTNPTNKSLYDEGGLFVHPHWRLYNMSLIPDWAHYFVGVYIGIVGIAGTAGNLLVLFMFLSTKSLRTPPNMFIINLAFSDMMFSAINGFPLLTISSFYKHWFFGQLWCELYGYLGGVFGLMSINTLAWISIDRYMVIAKPFYMMRHATHRRAAIQLVVVWVWALLWATPPLVGWSRYIPEGFHTTCSFDYLSPDPMNVAYVWCLFICGFVLPVCIIAFCYVNIVRAVAAQHRQMSKTAEKMGAKEERDRKQEIQTAKVAACSIGLFLLSWLPYATIAIAGILQFRQAVTPYTCMLPVLFAKTSAMYNPIVYALSHPKYQAALFERFPCLVCCFNQSDKDESETRSKTKGGRSNAAKRQLSRTDSECSDVSTLDSESGYTSEPSRKTKVSLNPGISQGAPSSASKRLQKSAETHDQPRGTQQNATQKPNTMSPGKLAQSPGIHNTRQPISSAAADGPAGLDSSDPAISTLHHLKKAYIGLSKMATESGVGPGGRAIHYQNPAFQPDGEVYWSGGDVAYYAPQPAMLMVPPVQPRRLSVPNMHTGYVYPVPLEATGLQHTANYPSPNANVPVVPTANVPVVPTANVPAVPTANVPAVPSDQKTNPTKPSNDAEIVNTQKPHIEDNPTGDKVEEKEGTAQEETTGDNASPTGSTTNTACSTGDDSEVNKNQNNKTDVEEINKEQNDNAIGQDTGPVNEIDAASDDLNQMNERPDSGESSTESDQEDKQPQPSTTHVDKDEARSGDDSDAGQEQEPDSPSTNDEASKETPETQDVQVVDGIAYKPGFV